MLSLRCYFFCLITVVPSLTLPAEAAWGGRHGGGTGWSGDVANGSYRWCYDYGYPCYAVTIIRVTGGCGYIPGYSFGYEYLNVYGPSLRGRSHAVVRGGRRVQVGRSAATDISSGSATPRVPPSSSKTAQAPAASASSRSPWTPMTVPISPSQATAPAKTATEQAGQAASDWVKKFELKLNQLSPDMSAASALLEQEGFRVDSGNKSATGWFLTAHDTNQRRGSIRLQSDGTKIAVTVAG